MILDFRLLFPCVHLVFISYLLEAILGLFLVEQ